MLLLRSDSLRAKRSKAPDDAGSDLGWKDDLSDGKDGRGPRIRCPKCGWEPRRDSEWMCVCYHVWNTFDTGGRCPGCGFQWKVTCCLSCLQWSPHRDWYVDGED